MTITLRSAVAGEVRLQPTEDLCQIFFIAGSETAGDQRTGVVKSLPTLTTLSLGSSYSAMSPTASGTSQAESRSGTREVLAQEMRSSSCMLSAETTRAGLLFLPERSVKGKSTNIIDPLGYEPLG